ncbi:hypothetical protein [Vibrio metoecus]|uniref:hypothetical protein n=1 Tax=Vibrio metoecus TaxID=1481663 RepID=UPI00215D2033|nr:hypothetical protein [Vibrio metoecus]MCR9385295.1 hypothetical protein [Vibrio metoecus]
MANLNEEPVWEAGIYQFETTDPVEGGPEGIDNKPARQLANRTAYLKQEQDKLKDKFDVEKTPNPLPQYMRFGDKASCWASMPIGHPFALETHIEGVEPPPTDDARFRFIKLSRNDAYNDDILSNEIVSGVAPVLSITAEINFPDSPLHGQRVELRNSSKPFSRAGDNGGIVRGDTMRNITASAQVVGNNSTEGVVLTGDGAIKSGPMTSSSTGFSSVTTPNVRSTSFNFDASRVVPTSNQVQPVHIEESYFMKIYG